MFQDLVDLSRWIIELFPAAYISAFVIHYSAKQDKFVYKYAEYNKDVEDSIQLLIFGAKTTFFEKVVAPRIAEIPRKNCCIKIKECGDERILISFRGKRRQPFTSSYSLNSSFHLDEFRDNWLSRADKEAGGFPNAPPQE